MGYRQRDGGVLEGAEEQTESSEGILERRGEKGGEEVLEKREKRGEGILGRREQRKERVSWRVESRGKRGRPEEECPGEEGGEGILERRREKGAEEGEGFLGSEERAEGGEGVLERRKWKEVRVSWRQESAEADDSILRRE